MRIIYLIEHVLRKVHLMVNDDGLPCGNKQGPWETTLDVDRICDLLTDCNYHKCKCCFDES